MNLKDFHFWNEHFPCKLPLFTPWNFGTKTATPTRVVVHRSPCVMYKAKAKTVARRKTIGNYEQIYGLDTVVVSRGFAMFRARLNRFSSWIQPKPEVVEPLVGLSRQKKESHSCDRTNSLKWSPNLRNKVFFCGISHVQWSFLRGLESNWVTPEI